MVKVLLKNLTIPGVGFSGDVVELSESEAEYYIGLGNAELMEQTSPETSEEKVEKEETPEDGTEEEVEVEKEETPEDGTEEEVEEAPPAGRRRRRRGK